MSSSVTSHDDTSISPGGRKSMLKLAQRMTINFCSGISAPSVHSWSKLTVGNVDPDVRIMTRKSVDDPSEAPGIVLSAATSVWLPASPQRLFDFLRNERMRCEWDILSNGGPMQEMAHIAKGQDQGNSVSLLRSNVSFLPKLHSPGMVIINSLSLVETLMDSDRWTEMFPCIVARSTTTDVISGGMAGTRNGAIQLMNAELQVLSPLVPVRNVNFLRFCKQHAEGVWAVVDVSIDTVRENSGGSTVVIRRLPSGCVVQDMSNGYSKVTWVEHAEYDENQIHHLYRPLLRSGLGFGSQRWVATLQRQCECLAILMSSSVTSHDDTSISPGGRKSMLKLAQRMTINFCSGISAPSVHSWSKLTVGNVDPDVRIMTRKSVDDPSEAPGIVLSAATSVWLPASPQRLFDFLRNERMRCEWDILSNGGPMQEMAHIAKGQDQGNSVSLLRSNPMNANQSSMLILQETCIDASGALVVYAPVDIPAMHVVMNGGDSSYVALLPSGFAVLPDGGFDGVSGDGEQRPVGGGSLLTVAFQILVNNLPTAKLTVESVETVNSLISCTVQKIRTALQCEN
ncbi:hypothetical protein Bca52824_061620 [Brassica carinata]|uniref:START domain-containing protein n=1 Tax=Brassica carinata TaxID=52824 RepID=A0A8X7QYU6_BRACI|nr:hypothetical protein Bca52824_061620 [Brassica carinata]